MSGARPALEEQGIDPETAAELDRMYCQEPYGEAYSACCRPGSWEYQTAWAGEMRQVLAARGYVATMDAACPWRLRWARPSVAEQLTTDLHEYIASDEVRDMVLSDLRGGRS